MSGPVHLYLCRVIVAYCRRPAPWIASPCPDIASFEPDCCNRADALTLRHGSRRSPAASLSQNRHCPVISTRRDMLRLVRH
jgi:hypothetical protein